MKATFNDKPVTNAINYGGEKELVAARSVVILDESKATPHLHEFIAVRWYRGHRQATTTWCSVWIYPPNGQHRSGSGRAAGQSLASSLEAALESAGVMLATPTPRSKKDLDGFLSFTDEPKRQAVLAALTIKPGKPAVAYERVEG